MTNSARSLMQTAWSYRMSRVLLSGFDLGVFTALSRGPRTSASLAQGLRLDARGLDRLLEALCALGLLRKKSGLFSNSKAAAAHLVEGRPGYLAGLSHMSRQWDRWTTLTEAVRRGGCVPRPGLDGRGRAWLESFIGAMHARAVQRAPSVPRLIGLSPVSSVLDVGGGSGAYAMAFARAKPGLTATVFDLPEVLPLTRRYIRDARLSRRVRTAAGDYEKDSLGAGYDLVFLSAIIHSNSPAVNRRLFRKAAEALEPGGRIAVIDFIMDEDRVAPREGALFALNMLVSTEAGDTYTEREVRDWLVEAGFLRASRRPAGTGLALILAQKPRACGKMRP
jgi:SAM-dependent methyltransferase